MVFFEKDLSFSNLPYNYITFYQDCSKNLFYLLKSNFVTVFLQKTRYPYFFSSDLEKKLLIWLFLGFLRKKITFRIYPSSTSCLIWIVEKVVLQLEIPYYYIFCTKKRLVPFVYQKTVLYHGWFVAKFGGEGESAHNSNSTVTVNMGALFHHNMLIPNTTGSKICWVYLWNHGTFLVMISKINEKTKIFLVYRPLIYLYT